MSKVITPIQYGIPEGMSAIIAQILIMLTLRLIEDDAWDPRHGATIQSTWGAKDDAPKHEFNHYPGES